MKFNRIIFTMIITFMLIISSFNSASASDPNFVIKRIDGKFGSGNGEFNKALDIELIDGNYYIADYLNDRVEVFDKDWNYVDQFGGTGSGLGQMDGPRALYFNGTYLFVVEGLNSRISLFKPNGDFVTILGEYGTGNGQFDVPTAVISDGERIYVSDWGNKRIQVFNESTMNYMYNFAPTQLQSPHGLAVKNDNLYICEATTHSIIKLNKYSGLSRGNAVYYDSTQPGYLGYPIRIKIINNNIVVTDSSHKAIKVYDINGNLIEDASANLKDAGGFIIDNNQIIIVEYTASRISILRGVANPSNLQTFAGDNGIILSWELNQNEGATRTTNYNIYRDAGSGLEFIGQSITQSFSDISAKPGMNYTYTVEATSSITTSNKVNSSLVSISQPDANIQTVTITEAGNSTSTDGSFLSSLPVPILPVVLVLIMIPVIMRRKKDSFS